MDWLVAVGHDGELNILTNITILVRLYLIGSCSTIYELIHLWSNSLFNVKTGDRLEEDLILAFVSEEELDVGKKSEHVVAVVRILTDVFSTKVEHKHDVLNQEHQPSISALEFIFMS